MEELIQKVNETNASLIDALLKHKSKISTLKAENERLLKQKNNVTRKNIVFYTTLQEIKAIVCGNYEIVDPQGRKDILKLITKAEEE